MGLGELQNLAYIYHHLTLKPTVGHQHVAVGIVAQEIPAGLDGVDRGGTQTFRGRRLKIFADRLPRAAAQGGPPACGCTKNTGAESWGFRTPRAGAARP
jgi:hypothetical protein